MVQNGSLEYVDMFDSYIHGEGDEDNVIPEEAFKNCTNLKSIILPQKTLALGYESFEGCHIDKIYCTGVPFSIKDDSFDERTKTECKLFVPNGMYNKYAWESKYWSEFKNIKEYNQNTVDNECVSFNNVNIRVIRRNIVLETVQNTHVSIYNINGTLVFSSSVKNNVSIPLQSGFYIVKYNDETKKIAIL